MNIRVDLNTNIADGSEVVFRSPADCSQVTGLAIYHHGGKTEFAFADAHGNNVGDIDHLFAENAVVKVILDVTASMAFVQNADTNAYIERTFVKSVNGQAPDKKGNVDVKIPEGGNGSTGAPVILSRSPSLQKPQTFIINNVQDSATYRTNGNVTEDFADKVLWDRSVRVSGNGAYIRFHTAYSPFSIDLKRNLLVVKIKINSIDPGAELYVKVGNKEHPSNIVSYNLMRNSASTIYGEWQEFTISYKSYCHYGETDRFAMVDFENITDVYVIASNGSCDFNLQFIGYRPNRLNKGVVSFTFDDGWKTAADGIKALAERGATGTLYVIKELTGGDFLTVDELKELRDLYGADIQAHGNAEYQTLTDAEIEEHFRSIKQYLIENGLSNGDHLAYPGGMNPKNAYNLARKYFRSARTIQGYSIFESYPPCDSHRMRAITGVSQNTSYNAFNVKCLIDHAVETNSWLILVFHKIDNGTDSLSCNMETFEEIVDYAIQSGADIKNIAEMFDISGNNEECGGGSGIEVSGAEVGQFLKVAAVDEKGVPTAWETAEPSTAAWRHIRTVTIPNDVTTDTSGVTWEVDENTGGAVFTFDTDKNGEKFTYNELFIVYKCCSTNSNNVMPALVGPDLVTRYWTQECIPLAVGKTNAFTTGWAALFRVPGTDYCIPMGAYNNNGGTGILTNMNSVRDALKYRKNATAISLLDSNSSANPGFAVGSTFDIYVR